METELEFKVAKSKKESMTQLELVRLIGDLEFATQMLDWLEDQCSYVKEDISELKEYFKSEVTETYSLALSRSQS